MTWRCPLCAADGAAPFHRDAARAYRRCGRCALVFVPPAAYLSRTAEHAFYRLHENAVDDPGYRRFLARLAEPLLARLPAGARGLDFGCGPAPALAAMLEQAGHQVALYDSLFQPEPATLRSRYDFVTASEVVEHLHQPGAVLAQLWSLLVPGGWLAVMTKLVLDADAFARWHYIRDPTHVCFFSRRTWQWWAHLCDAQLEFHGADVMLLRKPPA